MYLIFDGGNGGHLVMRGYGSYHIYDVKCGKLLRKDTFTFEEPMTNNEAEYNTLVVALHVVYFLPDNSPLVIEGDSELVRNQVLGLWQITKKGEHLKPFLNQIHYLLRDIKYTYLHVPRAEVVAVLGH
jgi:ribonuclease HI